MNSVRADVIRFFQDVLHVDAPTDDVDLIADGVLDSLAIVELVLYLERDCGVQVDVDALDLDDLRTVTAICRLVERASAKM